MMGYSDDKKLFSYLDYIGFGANSILPCGLSANENAESAANRALTILNQSDYCKNRISEHLPSWKSLARNEIEEVLRLAENDSAKKT